MVKIRLLGKKEDMHAMIKRMVGIRLRTCKSLQTSDFFYAADLEYKIRKIAFPSISTGVYSFPVGLATKIAVNTVAGFLKEHPDDFDLVEWVLFDEHME